MDRTWRTVLLVVLAAAIVWVGYLARSVVTPLLAALLLAYILDPGVRWLQRRGLSREVASGGVVVVALAALLISSFLAVRRVVEEGSVFYDRVRGEAVAEQEAPEDALVTLLGSETARHDVERVDAALTEGFWPERLGWYLDEDGDGERQAGEAAVFVEDRGVALLALVARSTEGEAARVAAQMRRGSWRGRTVWYVDEDDDETLDPGYARSGVRRVEETLEEYDLRDQFQDVLDHAAELGPEVASSAGEVLGRVVEGGQSAASTAIGLLTLLVLFPIYLYFSLVNLESVHHVAVRHLPRAQRDIVVHLLHRIHVTLSSFFRGRLLTMLAKGILLLGVFLAFGVPFAFVCALFAALASLVPVLGGIAGAAVPLLLAMAADAGAGELVGLAVALLAVEGVEGYILIPALIGKRVGLHPLTVLVSTFIAGDLLGVFGMLIGIPLCAVIKILMQELVLPEVRRRAGIEEPPRIDAEAGEDGPPPPGPPPEAAVPPASPEQPGSSEPDG